MKLLIEIDEHIYDTLECSKELIKDVVDGESVSNNMKIQWAILSGTPILDNATNGDVIKIVTGEFYWELVDEYGNHCMTDADGNRFDMDWWNTPYKGGN